MKSLIVKILNFINHINGKYYIVRKDYWEGTHSGVGPYLKWESKPLTYDKACTIYSEQCGYVGTECCELIRCNIHTKGEHIISSVRW